MELALWQSETHCDKLSKTSFVDLPGFIQLSRKSIYSNTYQSQTIELDRFEFVTLKYLDSSGIDQPTSPSHSNNRLKPP
jgi:hypothetical protein